MTATIATKAVHHLTLTVTDMDRARQFYTRLLSFQVIMEFGPKLLLTNGSTTILVLSPAPEEEAELAETNEDDPYFNSRDFCFVALAGDEVVGSCLNDAKTIEWPDSGRIGSLSIRRPYRGQGIAKGLVLHALNQFYQHGTRRVITDTDANSFTGANYLYQSAGMKIFRRDLLHEKELRAGRELRILKM